MKYFKLGKLPIDFVDFFKTEILKRKTDRNYQWVQFDKELNTQFLTVFENTELTVQVNPETNLPVQKALISNPDNGCTIHKDGIECKSALNIVLSCNATDWVRWYDENLINKMYPNLKNKNKASFGYSRDTGITNYERIPYIDELHTEVGDVYVLDVDSFHSFKCVGENTRIVIQTKFEGFPDLETIYNSLKHKSFLNLI
jgi:hypothetical protein